MLCADADHFTISSSLRWNCNRMKRLNETAVLHQQIFRRLRKNVLNINYFNDNNVTARK